MKMFYKNNHKIIYIIRAEITGLQYLITGRTCTDFRKREPTIWKKQEKHWVTSSHIEI